MSAATAMSLTMGGRKVTPGRILDTRARVQYTFVQIAHGRHCQGRLLKSPRIQSKENAMPVGPEKEKAIELAVSSIEKAFGKGSIMRLGNEDALVKDVQAISTGSLSLDIALGVG